MDGGGLGEEEEDGSEGVGFHNGRYGLMPVCWRSDGFVGWQDGR